MNRRRTGGTVRNGRSPGAYPGRTVSAAYNYESTARRLAPEEEPRERGRRRPRAQERRASDRRAALNMDLPYLMMLTAATITVLYICCSYVQVQSAITASMRNIQRQEEALEKLKSENDALQIEIDADVDLDHIYKVATDELGMVYAGRSQVICYKKTESGYVRQYEDIPGAKEK